MARVVSETCTVRVRWRWSRPTFRPQTMITPVLDARRCTRIGSVEGLGGGPAPAEPDDLVVAERVGPHPQQFAAVEVIEHDCVGVISSALDRAVAWQWISVNPAEHANKPALPHPDPKPPTAEEAGRLVERAWSKDPGLGCAGVAHHDDRCATR
jgi:hypothetical protein